MNGWIDGKVDGQIGNSWVGEEKGKWVDEG